jgi:hypothetical protein
MIATGPEDYEYDETSDDFDEDGYDPGEECGRWDNGRLTYSCSKAGSEECDWECPHRATLYKRKTRSRKV